MKRQSFRQRFFDPMQVDCLFIAETDMLLVLHLLATAAKPRVVLATSRSVVLAERFQSISEESPRLEERPPERSGARSIAAAPLRRRCVHWRTRGMWCCGAVVLLPQLQGIRETKRHHSQLEK